MRNLNVIAHEIRTDWKKVSPHALPYLDAMSRLSTIDDNYYHDTARSVVRYFLSNATHWRGDSAKRIKLELKSMI